MAVWENVHHNFPLLAKQSGFNFQSHRGRINWVDIENLDINEITEGRNFELLEQNLENVTNCNLKKECDFKILDRNFVKLFKLAQLGIEYLSYCQVYLDKCVILLQEQLMASQEECELLKKKLQKRKNEMRNKNKIKNLKFQCEKCSKVFISDAYLKFHEKRRHSGIDVSKISDLSPQTSSCNCQKNEKQANLLSTQTLSVDEEKAVSQENENANEIKANYLSKVEKLEHELENLKERIKKTETAVSEKSETPKFNAFHSINVPNSMHYNPTLMLLPSYLTHLGNSYCEVSNSCQIPVSDAFQPGSALPYSENSETVNCKHSAEYISECKTESSVLAERKCEEPIQEITNNSTVLPSKSQKCQSEAEELDCEKENVNPNAQIIRTLTKPLPPPRKLKKRTLDSRVAETKAGAKIDSNALQNAQTLNNQLIVISTPVKENQEKETYPEIFDGSVGNISEIHDTKENLTESFHIKKSSAFASESKSFIKKVIPKDSSSFQKLGKHFKKSFNNFYDSVSPNEKELTRKETNFQNIKASIVDGLNNHLQQLGICSEWSGLPKKTMRQKLSAWKHQRTLLCKDNFLYPVVRQNIEEKIFHKLKRNFKRKRFTSSKDKSENAKDRDIENTVADTEPEFVKIRRNVMYDTDTDSESEVLDSVSSTGEKEHEDVQKLVILEEKLSPEEKFETINDKKPESYNFQSKSSLSDVVKKQQRSLKESDKGFLDSDTDTSFSDNSDRKSLKKYVSNDTINNSVKPQVSLTKKAEIESQRVLKESGFHPKSNKDAQKKVLFEMYSNDLEEDLSDCSTDDDLWSLKSDLGRNAGFMIRDYN